MRNKKIINLMQLKKINKCLFVTRIVYNEEELSISVCVCIVYVHTLTTCIYKLTIITTCLSHVQYKYIQCVLAVMHVLEKLRGN